LGGLAVGTAAKFGSDFAQTAWTDSSGKLKKLFQFGSMKNGDALVGHEKLETLIDDEKVQVHRIGEGVLSTATDKKNSPAALFKTPEHLRRCGDKKKKAMVAAKKKDEKHRNLLDLPIEEWDKLDEDDKADQVDLYYEAKKAKAMVAAKKKDEKHRNLLDLPIEEWELLDEDDKADQVKEAKKAAKEAKKAAKTAFESLAPEQQEEAVELKKKEKHAEKYRKLLDLSTGEWELLDEDDKEDLVDLYYAEKKRVRQKKQAKRQKELRASRKFKDDLNQKLRDERASLTKEAKKEASRKRKLQPARMKQKRKQKRKLQ
jgi:hypothetical protein